MLIQNGERPLRTHDLDGLLKTCARFDASLDSLTEACEGLTEFAVDARYEDFLEYNTETIARRAIEAAELISNAIRERLRL